MENSKMGKDAVNGIRITFYVAECMEFPRYGERREDILSAEEAVKFYEAIPSERLNAVKGIGVHVYDQKQPEFLQEFQLVHMGKMDVDMLQAMYGFDDYPQILRAARELISAMPELEVIDTGKLLNEKEDFHKSADVMEIAGRINQFQKSEETTVLNIVDNLEGLTRGAFYHHFKSKEEVLDALGIKLFWDNNPFEKVNSEKDLNGLEKIKKAIKLSFQNEKQQKVGIMSISLLKNPRILTEYIESNQYIVYPFLKNFFKKRLQMALSSLFTLLTNIWLQPAIFPCSKSELLERLYFTKDLLENLGVPIIDEEILDYVKNVLEKMVTE